MCKRNTALILAALVAVFASHCAWAVEAPGVIIYKPSNKGKLTPNGRRYFDANVRQGVNPDDMDSDWANSNVPELHADVMLGSLTAQRTFRSVLPSIHTYSQTAHMTALGNSVESDSALASSAVGGKKWVMWDTPWLTHETRKREDGYLGYRNTSSGFATGISRLIGESGAVGLAIGYDGRKQTNRDKYSRIARADALHTALYGGAAVGCFFVDAYAGWSRSWHRSSRKTFGGAANPTYKGNYADSVLSTGAKISYVWILPGEFRLTPAIGLDYSHMRLGAFGDNSRPGRQNIRKATQDFVQAPITMSLNKTFSADFLKFKGACSLWTPELRGGWVPELGDKRATLQYRFPGDGSSMTAKSATLGDSHGFVGAGLKIKLADRLILGVDYNYAFRSEYANHTITGTYGVSF